MPFILLALMAPLNTVLDRAFMAPFPSLDRCSLPIEDPPLSFLTTARREKLTSPLVLKRYGVCTYATKRQADIVPTPGILLSLFITGRPPESFVTSLLAAALSFCASSSRRKSWRRISAMASLLTLALAF